MVNRRSIFKRMESFLLPGACLLCETQSRKNALICHDCRLDLPAITGACLRCGRSLPEDAICAACLHQPPLFDRVLAVHTYQYPVADLVRAMKYQQKILLAREAGESLSELLLLKRPPLPECIIPVPLHRHRLCKRGFNQALEIARIVAKRLQVKLDRQALIRVRSTLPQFDLSPQQRIKNLKDAFGLSRPLHYRHIAIVDDVITTGATANEMARLLRTTGVTKIDVWAYARAT